MNMIIILIKLSIPALVLICAGYICTRPHKKNFDHKKPFNINQ